MWSTLSLDDGRFAIDHTTGSNLTQTAIKRCKQTQVSLCRGSFTIEDERDIAL